MPAWIHNRADRLKADLQKQYGKKKGEQVAFAIATQMAHRLGKSPKTFKSKVTGKKESFGTPQARREAKAKFDKPLKEYQKTAEVLPEFLAKPMRGESLDPASEEFAQNRAFGKSIGPGILGGGTVGAITGGVLGAGGAKGSFGRGLAGALLGHAAGTGLTTAALYPFKKRRELEMQAERAKTAAEEEIMVPTLVSDLALDIMEKQAKLSLKGAGAGLKKGFQKVVGQAPRPDINPLDTGSGIKGMIGRLKDPM